jgi:hypothetical protein
LAVRAKAPHHRHEQRRPVGHSAVDHLPRPTRAYRQQRAHHAERQHQPAAAEIADKVNRRGWRTAGAPASPEHARDRDIVDVMARQMRKRPVLPPAGHPAIDELRIVREQHLRAEAQPLHHARTVALDQAVAFAAQRPQAFYVG